MEKQAVGYAEWACPPRCKKCRYSFRALGKYPVCDYVSHTGRIRGTSITDCDKYAPVQDAVKLPPPGAVGAQEARRKNERTELMRELLETAARGRDTGVLLNKLEPHEVFLLNELLRKILKARGSKI
jgi:hypothetical protein